MLGLSALLIPTTTAAVADEYRNSGDVTTAEDTSLGRAALLRKYVPAVAEQIAVPQAPQQAKQLDQVEAKISIVTVPFYSQFTDISAPEWRKLGCGVASLAMIIDYYTEAVTVDNLLERGLTQNAYLANAGWIHAGLINLAKEHGLTGQSVSLAHLSETAAFTELERVLTVGPVMASVHYTFEPTNPIPHLVVINDVKDGLVYYNDPAEPTGGGSLTIDKFLAGWKQRYIEIRPAV